MIALRKIAQFVGTRVSITLAAGDNTPERSTAEATHIIRCQLPGGVGEMRRRV